jgi:hypothetical protein
MTVFRQVDDIVASRVAGETLLVPICDRLADMNRVFALDDVPSFIWERIDGKRSCDDIAREISEAFDVPLAEASGDVQAFLRDLREAGLIKPA